MRRVRSALTPGDRQCRSKSLLDDLTRPLDQVADNEGRGLDLVYQPDTLAGQEIHGLDIPGSRSVWWEPHKPEHRYSLTRNLGLAHHRFIWPGPTTLPLARAPSPGAPRPSHASTKGVRKVR